MAFRGGNSQKQIQNDSRGTLPNSSPHTIPKEKNKNFVVNQKSQNTLKKKKTTTREIQKKTQQKISTPKHLR